MLVNSYLHIFVRVMQRGPEACARKRWQDRSATEGNAHARFAFRQTKSYLFHVIVGPNAYILVCAVMIKFVAQISIKPTKMRQCF